MRRVALLGALLLGPLLATTVAGPAHASAAGTDDVDVTVSIPGVAQGRFEVDDAQLRWGLNAESGSGAFFGGCNFLSAGMAGDAGSARVWTESDGLFATTSGDVTIQKPTTSGDWQDVTWANKCQNASGDPVTSRVGDYGTGITAAITGGTGVVDVDEGTATISWEGTISVVFYGGLTYWWFSDPVLTVQPDGTGTVTATLGGFGADMDNPLKWQRLSETPDVTIATLGGVSVSGSSGIRTVPLYAGVRVSTQGGREGQVREGDSWGAFPQDFVDFQVQTGQSSYWYSSGGIRDFAKPASTLWISYDATAPVDDSRDTTRPSSNAAGTGSGGTGLDGDWGSGTALDANASTTGTAGGANTSVPATQAGTTTSDEAAASALPTATTPTWLTPGGLIPSVLDAVATDPRARLALAGTGLLGLASVAFVGLRRGWLVLPFTRQP